MCGNERANTEMRFSSPLKDVMSKLRKRVGPPRRPELGRHRGAAGDDRIRVHYIPRVSDCICFNRPRRRPRSCLDGAPFYCVTDLKNEDEFEDEDDGGCEGRVKG